MARFAVFSILVVAVAVSGACAGLIPSILPIPIPVPDDIIPDIPSIIPTPRSRDDAIKTLNRGASLGKGGINARISVFIANSNRDASLTPLSKQCIAEQANQIRQNTLSGIDTRVGAIQNEIQAASEAWLPVWIEIIADLPNVISGIINNCQDSLDTAKTDCIAQTQTPATA